MKGMKSMKKGMKNRGRLSKKQFEILQGLSNFLTVKQIAKHRQSALQGIYKSLQNLVDKGYVEKIGKNYAITSKGMGGMKTLVGLSKGLRLHNLGFKFLIQESPKNWDKKRSTMTSFPYFDKRIQLNNNYQDFFSMGNIKIKTTSRSVIIHLPAIYSKDVNTAVIKSMEQLYDVIPKVESQFKVKLVKDRKANITIISQEWARIDDSLAKLYRKENKKLYITDEEGKVWLIADYSFNMDELETIDPYRGDEDMDIIHPFMNDLRKNPVLISQILEAIAGNTANQTFHSENLVSHVKAVQNLSTAVTELRHERYKPFFIRWYEYFKR